MHSNPPSKKLKFLATTGIFALVFWSFLDLREIYSDVFAVSHRFPYSLPLIAGFILVISTLSLFVIWKSEKAAAWIGLLKIKSWMKWGIAGVIFLGFSYFLLMTKWGAVFSGTAIRTFFIYASFFLAFLFLREKTNFWPEFQTILASLILFGTIFTLVWTFQGVTDYPFRLSWSEGNRFWDYSVLFGHRLYNFPADEPIPAYIDLGRQSLWGLPFLFTSPTIFQIRLWNAILYSLPYFLLGILVFRKKNINPATWVLIGLWTFLFFTLGPIYSPLVLAAILVTVSMRLPFVITLLLVGVAGYYAELTRYTWMFAPAIWAWVISFGKIPRDQIAFKSKPVLQSLALTAAGIIGGFIVPLIREQSRTSASGDTANVLSEGGLAYLFGRQPLLWDRLLPNPTFNLGLLPALILATAPILILLFLFWKSGIWDISRIQQISIILGLSAFLVVGIIVSVKIGGGSNLHNFDMFLICVLFVMGLAWEKGAGLWGLNHSSVLVHSLIFLAVAYPAINGIYSAQPIKLPDKAKIENALEKINQKVSMADQQGEVLFIDHRQLLTFGYVEKIKLVPDYEKKWLMDEAISGNEAFFVPFYEDLKQKRFALIVTEPLRGITQGDESQFGLENDAWVKWVSIPVLDYYKPVFTDVDIGVQLLEPIKIPPEVSE